MSRASLAGLRVLLTRPEGEGADEWAAAFVQVGAVPIAYPTVAIRPPESWRPVDESVANLDAYDWMVFTSQTAVGFFARRLPNGLLPSDLRAEIAAVGQNTAQAVERKGGKVALVPADNRQEGLVQALRDLPAGTRVLLPLAAGARGLLAQSLRAIGCTVDVVTVYRTEPKRDLPAPPEFDVAVFASPSDKLTDGERVVPVQSRSMHKQVGADHYEDIVDRDPGTRSLGESSCDAHGECCGRDN